MKRFLTFTLCFVAISGFAASAFSATPVQAPDTPAAAKIRATIHARYPKVNIGQITPAPVPGLFELVTDAGLVYTDANGDFLFLGKIIDTKTQDDLTEARWNQVNGIDFEKLPFELAIKFVKGDGKRRLAVFEDPHCPFCAQFENELQKMTNVTVYVFLYPLESLHPGATKTAHNIWCSKDRAAAWTGTMLRKETPPPADCKSDALKTLAALGDKLNINGTPTLFFVDGNRHAGTMSAERLETALNSIGQNTDEHK